MTKNCNFCHCAAQQISNDPNVTYSGFLNRKVSGSFTTWTQNYVIICDGNLYMYKTSKSTKPCVISPLYVFDRMLVFQNCLPLWSFALTSSLNTVSAINLAAPTQRDMNLWIEELNLGINYSINARLNKRLPGQLQSRNCGGSCGPQKIEENGMKLRTKSDLNLTQSWKTGGFQHRENNNNVEDVESVNINSNIRGDLMTQSSSDRTSRNLNDLKRMNRRPDEVISKSNTQSSSGASNESSNGSTRQRIITGRSSPNSSATSNEHLDGPSKQRINEWRSQRIIQPKPSNSSRSPKENAHAPTRQGIREELGQIMAQQHPRNSSRSNNENLNGQINPSYDVWAKENYTFHGNKEEALNEIRRSKALGSYLIRYENNRMVLTVRCRDRFMKYDIIRDQDTQKFQLYGEKLSFATIGHLLQYYHGHKLPNVNLSLVVPYKLGDQDLCPDVYFDT